MEGVPYLKRAGRRRGGERIRYVRKGEGGVVGKRRGGKGGWMRVFESVCCVCVDVCLLCLLVRPFCLRGISEDVT